METSGEEYFPFEKAPAEVVVHILSYLRSSVLLRFSCTSRRYNFLAEDAWRMKCAKRYAYCNGDYLRKMLSRANQLLSSTVSLSRLKRASSKNKKELKKSSLVLSGSKSSNIIKALYQVPPCNLEKDEKKQEDIVSSLSSTSDGDDEEDIYRCDDHSEDRFDGTPVLGWKFLYYHLISVESEEWFKKRDSKMTFKFHDKHPRDAEYKHHLFPTCSIIDKDTLICGSGVHEMASEPSTLFVGNRTIKLWDIHTGKHIKTLDGHSSAITSLLRTPIALYSTSRDDFRNIKIWNMKKMSFIGFLNGHDKCVNQIVNAQPFNSTHPHPYTTKNCDLLYTCSKDRTVKMWKVYDNGNTTECLMTFYGHPKSVRSISPTFSSYEFITGCVDHKLRLFDVYNSQESLRKWDVHKNIRSISPLDENTVICAAGNKLHLVDTRMEKIARSCSKGANGKPFGIISQLQLICSSDIPINLSDYLLQHPVTAVPCLHKRQATQDYSPDAFSTSTNTNAEVTPPLLSSSISPAAITFMLSSSSSVNPSPQVSLPTHAELPVLPYSTLLVGDTKGFIRVVDAYSMNEIASMQVSKSSDFYCFSYSKEQKMLMTGDIDHTVKLWDMGEGGERNKKNDVQGNGKCIIS